MPDPLSSAAHRAALRHAQSAVDSLKLMDVREKRTLSLVDIMEGIKSYGRVTGYADEHLQERARLRGTDHDPQSPRCPWSLLHVETRSPLSAGLGGVGGAFLVDSVNQAGVIDVLRPHSLAMQAGATVFEGLEANAIFPRLATDISGQWLTSESTSATEQPPLFGGAAVQPKTWGFTCRWSRQLQLQAPNMERFLRAVAARAAGQALDVAALNGVGGVGVPLGLLNYAGVGAQSGTTYSHANSLTTRGTLAAANVDDASIAWIGHPGVRTILGGRERNAGNEYVWNTIMDQITGRRAFASTAMPSATLVAGDWSNLAYCFFGDGFQIDSTAFNSSSDFQSGISALRLLVSADTFLQHASAFVSITSVT